MNRTYVRTQYSTIVLFVKKQFWGLRHNIKYFHDRWILYPTPNQFFGIEIYEQAPNANVNVGVVHSTTCASLFPDRRLNAIEDAGMVSNFGA